MIHKDTYGIFNRINILVDNVTDKRGMRRRPSPTCIFVLQGMIKLIEGNDTYDVLEGEEFVVSPGCWHGWISTKDTVIIQYIDNYIKNKEEKKDFE